MLYQIIAAYHILIILQIEYKTGIPYFIDELVLCISEIYFDYFEIPRKAVCMPWNAKRGYDAVTGGVMANYRIDTKRLDRIIDKTVEAIELSKNEIIEISENANKECRRLEEELNQLKKEVKELIEVEEIMELQLKNAKKKLMFVSKRHEKYSQEEKKKAYADADSLRIELAIKREQEQYLIKRRNDLEVRIKEYFRTIDRAKNLYSLVDIALTYLSGDLKNMAMQVDDMQQRQIMGLRIIKAQEEERQRVARDIHDGPAQSMSNVVLKAEICERLVSVDIGKTKDELYKLKGIVRESLQDVRKIIYNLRPMSLDDLGLVPTLQRLVLTFGDETDVEVSFNKNGVFDDIKPVISLTLFRIVQEALSNISKHAEAQNVAVNLEFKDEEIKLYIYDDGKGFDLESVKEKGEGINSGFGLFSMRERVELLSGEFNISSEPGKGTRLNIAIPMIKDEEEDDGKNTSADS